MTRKGRRTVGRGMRYACRVVAACLNDPPSKSRVARQVGPNGSLFYGSLIVDRAIRAGLIEARGWDRKGNPVPASDPDLYRYTLHLTAVGLEVASS